MALLQAVRRSSSACGVGVDSVVGSGSFLVVAWVGGEGGTVYSSIWLLIGRQAWIVLGYYEGDYLALGGGLCSRLHRLRSGGRLDHYCDLCAILARNCLPGGQIVRAGCDILCVAFCDLGRFRVGCDVGAG